MGVDNWARREAERVIPAGRDREFVGDGIPHAERIRFADGIAHAFSALLSDEAVEAAADLISDATEPGNWSMVARAAFRAAIDAVTKDARND